MTVQETRPSTHPEIQDYRYRTLIDGALRCMAEAGLEGTSVRAIALAAGSSRGLIGHHFGSRDQLLVEAHKYLCDLVADEVMKQINSETMNPRARLIAMPTVVFSESVLTDSHAKAFVAFWHMAAANESIRRNHEMLYESYRRQLAAVFDEAQEHALVKIDSKLASLTLIALIDGLWLQIFLERTLSREDALNACIRYIDHELGIRSCAVSPG